MRPEPVFDADGVTLYAGDCFDVFPFLGPVDAVIGDLPFGTTRNHWDRELPLEKLWHHYRSLMGARTPVVLFGLGSFTARLITSNLAQYKYGLVWAKEDERGNDISGHLNAKRQPLRVHEDLVVFYDQQCTYNPQMVATGRVSHSRGSHRERTTNHFGTHFNTPVVDQGGMQHPTSVVRFRRPKMPKGQGHPNQKPVALLRWLIRTYTNPGDVVLDNVCGSATTLVAARAEGRRAIGIELHPPYVEDAAARLASGSEEDRW